MTIKLERLDDAFHLRATNEQGNSVETDASPAIGGGGRGMRPMEMLLSSLGACSSIDVIDILRKMRQPLQDIKVTLNGEREKDKTPSLFTDIHIVFDLYGDLDVDKAKRAVDMSMEKYCSVAKIVEKTAKITWEANVVAG
ncbi:OsmC family protein [Haliscomenobacter hydrossis]|uniref:OsmC family protein n=1 Tax=Haliscomenobacter hydrossis (strain ATCC 27775 / DSM 1100 / LMG 10767 / O) TaxID=760192 RepID=F4KTK0_HALH1|nr:OsmC family protein [Haliscomenobacter hydrossis]AEE53374.1 OsmC family protein [Haliscomenobacter hydrossis DSM 1100]